MNQIEAALQTAIDVHTGQLDKEGKPFILHVLAVALQGQNDAEIITGLLHDVIEDSAGAYTRNTLIDLGFSQDIVEAVDHLTRWDGETYWNYIDRCLKNPLATHIKVYDLIHNTDPNRQNFAGAKSLMARHNKALDLAITKALDRQ